MKDEVQLTFRVGTLEEMGSHSCVQWEWVSAAFVIQFDKVSGMQALIR